MNIVKATQLAQRHRTFGRYWWYKVQSTMRREPDAITEVLRAMPYKYRPGDCLAAATVRGMPSDQIHWQHIKRCIQRDIDVF